MTFTKEFYCLLNFIGWGDPHNGIWTIGIEEGGAWCIENMGEKEKENFIKLCGEDKNKKYGLDYIKKCINEKFCKEYTYIGNEEELKWPIANASAKIGCALSEEFEDKRKNWREYRDYKLWRKGSKIFNGNIYPLGKKSLQKNFPECYVDLFGISYNNINGYYTEVEKYRFKKIKDFYKEKNPQAVICYGKTYWNEFKKVFELEDKYSRKINNQLEIYPEEKIILAKHFSRIPNTHISKIIQILIEWEVTLP